MRRVKKKQGSEGTCGSCGQLVSESYLSKRRASLEADARSAASGAAEADERARALQVA